MGIRPSFRPPRYNAYRQRCDDDPEHSTQVARLAVDLFDGLQTLHGLGPAERDYLEAGALLANVGLVVAHSKHHLHAYYVIRNSELAGLTDAEIAQVLDRTPGAIRATQFRAVARLRDLLGIDLRGKGGSDV